MTLEEWIIMLYALAIASVPAILIVGNRPSKIRVDDKFQEVESLEQQPLHAARPRFYRALSSAPREARTGWTRLGLRIQTRRLSADDPQKRRRRARVFAQWRRTSQGDFRNW